MANRRVRLFRRSVEVQPHYTLVLHMHKLGAKFELPEPQYNKSFKN